MKANELMLGDLVTFKDCQNDANPVVIKIWQINADGDAFVSIDGRDELEEISIDDEIVGIPFTPEILEKNGFQKQAGEVWEYDIFSKDKSLASMIVWRRDYATPSLTIRSFVLQYGTYSRRDIKYIHELQHALRFCGIEKEITLN